MRFSAIALVCLCFLAAGCKSTATADSCSAKSPAKSERHFFKRQPRTDHGKKAEKGKKKQRDETKAEKKWHLFRRKKAGEKDAGKQDKGLFHNSGKKQRKMVKKRTRHPQNGLFPKGHPG